MPKTFRILNISAARGCMLVRYIDGVVRHETEIPLPSALPAGTTPTDVSEWVERFWPHSQIEVGKGGINSAVGAAVGKDVDITDKIPEAADALRGEPPLDPPV